MGIGDKAKDKLQQATGKGKEAVGDATNNQELRREGQKDQVAGNVKETGRNVGDKVEKAAGDVGEKIADATDGARKKSR